VLREAFEVIWHPEMSLLFLMLTFVWLHNRWAAYPIGGSMPMIEAVERRYRALGGEVTYGARVTKILVENNRAVGVRLENGQEDRADVVISAADGHATIFDMLEGRYVDDTIRGYYDRYMPFPSLMYIGLGVNRTFENEPRLISGFSFPLDDPLPVGDITADRLAVRIMNYDDTMAPPGKTVITTILPGDYAYWTAVRVDREKYEAEKQRVAAEVVRVLDARYPGLANQVEMIDVATPVTFERYTGNWKASYEGWMPTPENAIADMNKTLPGLDNFYMVGQWVAPGGGLPAGVKTGRDVVQMLCHKDGVRFKTMTE
jgi:phytoene dehydrogenase-like protein